MNTEQAKISIQCRPHTISSQSVVVVRFVDSLEFPLTWWDVALALSNSSQFRQQWHQTWASVDFDFQWKPIPLHPKFSETQPFFAVLVPARFPPADVTAYQEYLEQKDEIAIFPNLSGDAQLMIPPATGDYGHIAAFCRTASSDLAQAFWQQLGEILRHAIAHKDTIWCNTHGHGVPWFHLRFDQTFKYAAFPPQGKINRESLNLWYQNIYAQVF